MDTHGASITDLVVNTIGDYQAAYLDYAVLVLARLESRGVVTTSDNGILRAWEDLEPIEKRLIARIRLAALHTGIESEVEVG